MNATKKVQKALISVIVKLADGAVVGARSFIGDPATIWTSPGHVMYVYIDNKRRGCPLFLTRHRIEMPTDGSIEIEAVDFIVGDYDANF